MNSKLFFLSTISLLIIFYSCIGKSKLPDKMPEQTEIRYGQNGGMSPYFKSIEIIGDTLIFSERKNTDPEIIKWSKKIKITDKENLYQLFRENRFDRIKNKHRKGIVYDAGSEGISIRMPGNIVYHVSYGSNFPLSARNKKRYTSVVNAIEDLLTKYKND